MKVDIYGDGIGCVEYVQHSGDDVTIVNAARVSFGKQKETLDEKDKKLIRYLIKHKHTSTLEHNTITFRFTVPLFIRSQHHRHRTWSYNEISRRYTSVDIRFYEPLEFRVQHKSNRQASDDKYIDPLICYKTANDTGLSANVSALLKNHHKTCVALYDAMMNSGICREQARGVLPQNLYTEYFGTVNLNNLLKFIELRLHEGAQYEIRQVAQACLEIATNIWPESVSAYREIRGLNSVLEEGT